MRLYNNKKFLEFVDYVYSFYGEYADDSLYPIEGCTWRVCYNSCKEYVLKVAGTDAWGYGDSVDREKVRDIILAKGYNFVKGVA